MSNGRHLNARERFIADCTQNVFAGVTHMTTDRKDEEFNPKKAVKYRKCARKSTKVDGKCMFDKKCRTEAMIYNIKWVPTVCTYIGKSHRATSQKE